MFKDLGLMPCSLDSYIENPSPEKIALTFDDGYESVFTNAYPALLEWGGGCTVFLVTGFVGGWNRWEVNLGWRRFRHLSWSMVREMKNAEFASHTVTHPCLTRLPAEEIRLELSTSKKTIEDRMGKAVKYLSLPFGRFNNTVLQIARECGYEGVCSLAPAPLDNDHPGFLIPRTGVYLLDTDYTMKCKLGRAKLAGLERMKLKMINRLSGGTIWVKGMKKEPKSVDLIEK